MFGYNFLQKQNIFLTICWALFYLQDQDVMHSWLLDLHFEEYFPLFLASGYDMPTITKMTPEVCVNFFIPALLLESIFSYSFFTIGFLACN